MPRRGCAVGSCAARPSGPAPVAAAVLALGKGLMQRDHLRHPLTRERARSARLCIRPHPAALGETARSRGPAPCPTPTVEVAGSGAGGSACCGGGASTLEETTVYSPSNKSLLRPYARCSMQRAMFLTFVAKGWSTPQLTLREDGHSGRLAAANSYAHTNARCGGPPPPDGGIETAGRPPK